MNAFPVSFLTVGELLEAVENYRLPTPLSRQKEAARVWRPHYEKLLECLAETVEEGWPFQVYGEDWGQKVAPVLECLSLDLQGELSCHFPQRSDSNLRVLQNALQKALSHPRELTGREVGLCRTILCDSEEKWGKMGSPDRRSAIEQSTDSFADSTLETELAELKAHLLTCPQDSGLAEFELDRWTLTPQLKDKLRRTCRRPLQEALEEQKSQKELAFLLSQVEPQTPREAEEALRMILVSLWRLQVDFYLSPAVKRGVNRLLRATGLDFQMPSAWSKPGRTLLQMTWAGLSDSFYQEYYQIPKEAYGGPEEFASVCVERAGEGAPSGAVSVEAETLLGGGSWALWQALQPQADWRLLAENHLAQFYELHAKHELKPYRRQRALRLQGKVWRQMVFFLSQLEVEEQREFFSAQQNIKSPEFEALKKCGQGESVSPVPIWIESESSFVGS